MQRAIVFLPDGSSEVSDIPDDVDVVPIHPVVDLCDIFLPEYQGFAKTYLAIYDHHRVDLCLDASRRQILLIGPVCQAYGNPPVPEGGYPTIRDAIRAGRVVTVDGLPWYPVVSADLAVQARYRDMRREGQSHRMAEMLATRSFPGIKSDSIWNEGRCNGNQFEACPKEGDWLRAQATAAGVSTTGKTYLRGLASFPGDPTAWVDGRGDAVRVAREKGFNIVDGYVKYTAPERAPLADVEIAPDLVAAEVGDILDANPGLRRGDVEEKVYGLRAGRVDPNPLRVQDVPA